MVSRIQCLTVESSTYQLKDNNLLWKEAKIRTDWLKRSWIEFLLMMSGEKNSTNSVKNLVAPTSDHSALYFQIKIWRLVARRSRFRFENSWLREKRCSEIMMDCWY